MQQREAVERILKAVCTLQVAMRRGDAALNLTPPAIWTPPQTWTEFIPLAWQHLEPQLVEMRERLDAWLASRQTPRRRPGQPHDGRFHLRIAVFQMLQRHGVQIRVNGKSGVAARVLAVVLEEADRLDGKPPLSRADFNGTQWKNWVGQHRAANVLLRPYEADHGIRPRDMIKHLDLIRRTF